MNHRNRAFTLVEIIVALAIFSIVAVVALGALVKIISANKKAQTLQSAITNLNYAMESISREMRVGKKYYCDRSYPTDSLSSTYCSSGLDSSGDVYIAFESPRTAPDTSPDGKCNLITAYQLTLDDSGGGTSINKWKQDACDYFPGGTSDFSSTIDPNVTLDGYFVKIDNSSGIPIATIRVSGYAGVREREKTYFDVQTSISPRIDSNE